MIDRATRFSPMLIALLAAACGGSRPSGSGNDASDVGTHPSDAGVEMGQDVPVTMDTGVDMSGDVPVVMDTGVDMSGDVPVVMDTGGPEIPAACGTIPTTATLTSHLRITADNECDVYVNGTMVGSTNNWGVAVTIDVSLYVHPGRKNVIAVRGTNTSSQDGNDRGIIGQLTVDADGGVAPLVVTDKDWRTSATVPDVDAGGADWTALDYNDAAWSMATEVASNGDPPWGAVFGASAAKWIWSAPIPSSTSAKPNLETTYARRTFYFSLDGGSIASAPACP